MSGEGVIGVVRRRLTLFARPDAPECLMVLFKNSIIKSSAMSCPGLPRSEPQRFERATQTSSVGYSRSTALNRSTRRR